MGKTGLKARENDEMGRNGDCFGLAYPCAGSGRRWLPPRRALAVVIMWGMGLESEGVEVESCRWMIKAFVVFPGVYSILQDFDIKMAYSPFV